MNRLLTVAFVLASLSAAADIKLNPLFSSNMVLQQEKPIRFFGTADKDSVVNVEFNGNKVSAKADAKGKWLAEFPAIKAGKTNYIVKISDGKKKIELKDVVVGEVWFCSGQSNMVWPVGRTKNSKQEIADAKYPDIRFAVQANVNSHNKKMPARHAWRSWGKCTPKSVSNFSATAYFFGRTLHKDLDVPVGLISSAWNGTGINSWISEEGFQNAGLQKEYEQIGKFKFAAGEKQKYEAEEFSKYAEKLKAWYPLFEKAGADAKTKSANWAAADFDDSAWTPAKVFQVNKYCVYWYRTKFTLPENLKNKPVTLNMGKLGDAAELYLNGKQLASWKLETPGNKRGVKITLAPEQLNQNGENILAVRTALFHRWSNAAILQITKYGFLSNGKTKFALNKNWKAKQEFSCTKKETGNNAYPLVDFTPYASVHFPSNLYNGMVDGWTKFPIRGVIWYQGCNNAGQPHYYLQLKALISDWRTKWNVPDMPFMIVQLAGYDPRNAKTWQKQDATRVSGYALTRDIQQQMLKLSNIGLACAIDIGEASNIHPANKQDVGKRLALEAERIVYGKKIVSRGPMFDSAKAENGSMRVTYLNAENGLKTSDGKAPGAFAIAGADKKFVWADAKIDGKTVIVSSPKVKEPKYVRYAYIGYRGDCNLQNAASVTNFL